MKDSKIIQTGIKGALRLANRMARAKDIHEALRMAVEDIDVEEARRLLDEEEIDINAKKGKFETTVLMEAAVRGSLELLDLFIERGADLNEKDKDGWTALMAATIQGHLQVVEQLLAHGAEVDARNCNEETAFAMAVSTKKSEIESVLSEHGAKL